MGNTYRRIYEIVMLIPEGRVATYGQIAELIGNKNLSRVVGNALHHNPDPEKIPCHRVVNKMGYLSQMYAFGEVEKQKKKLISEGIQIINNKVNLNKFQWEVHF